LSALAYVFVPLDFNPLYSSIQTAPMPQRLLKLAEVRW